MTIILVRHGETPFNVARVLQPTTTPLSENGRGQADAVAQRVAALGAAGLVSSDLTRAMQTAQAISKASALPMSTTPLLRERDFGELRGLAYDTLGYDPIHSEAAPPGGESMADFRHRVAAAFAHVVALRAALAGPLVVVSHGLVLRELITRHITLSPGSVSSLQMANTSVTIIEPTSPYRTHVVDCTRHLDANTTPPDSRSLSGG